MFDLDRLLRVLVAHDVRFLVVGGVAAALQGAPVLTQDVDILYLIEEENLSLERLVELKRELGRPKDRAILPVLEATLRERERR